MGNRYITSKMTENEDRDRKLYLDNKEVSPTEFNTALEGLHDNQRIVESSKDNFHIIERFFG